MRYLHWETCPRFTASTLHCCAGSGSVPSRVRTLAAAARRRSGSGTGWRSCFGPAGLELSVGPGRGCSVRRLGGNARLRRGGRGEGAFDGRIWLRLS